jgi:hypothetical protein
MAARKRGDFESYKSYKKNLKKEESAVKKRLRGWVVWPGDFGTARKVFLNGRPFLTGSGRKVALSI